MRHRAAHSSHRRFRLALVIAGIGALLVGAAGASVAVAGPGDPTSPYQFASNYGNGGAWQVSDNPQTHADSWQTTPGLSDVVAIDPASGQYADSGVVVPVGTLGSLFTADGTFKGIFVDGPDTAAVHVNLYADTNGDGHYLSFTYNGVYQGQAGDEIALDVDTTPPTRAAFAAGDNAQAWAWVGVSGNTPQSAKISSVHNYPLFLPSVLAVANLCRVSSATTQNLWLVSNVAGNRDRDFHLGVQYGGATHWTGLHTVAAGKTVGVMTSNGGTAIVKYYDGSGANEYATPYPTAVSDHTKYCG
jgi:hypothetical protein